MSTRTDSFLVGAYLPFPLRLGPDVTVERLAVRIGAAIQSVVDECERRQAMKIADAVAEEREECAKVVEKTLVIHGDHYASYGGPSVDAEELAAAIRARGQKA